MSKLETIVGLHDDPRTIVLNALHDVGCTCPEKQLGVLFRDADHVLTTHSPGCRYLRRADDSPKIQFIAPRRDRPYKTTGDQ